MGSSDRIWCAVCQDRPVEEGREMCNPCTSHALTGAVVASREVKASVRKKKEKKVTDQSGSAPSAEKRVRDSVGDGCGLLLAFVAIVGVLCFSFGFLVRGCV